MIINTLDSAKVTWLNFLDFVHNTDIYEFTYHLDCAYKCVTVPQPGPLSLYVKLEDSSIAILDFYILQFTLWMIFKGPYIFTVMALWYTCKAALGECNSNILNSR